MIKTIGAYEKVLQAEDLERCVQGSCDCAKTHADMTRNGRVQKEKGGWLMETKAHDIRHPNVT